MATYEVFREGRLDPVHDLGSGWAAVQEAGGFLWVVLDHPTMADFADVEQVLGLHPLAVEDAVHAHDRPKLDVYDEARFFTLMSLRHRDAMAPLDVGRVMAFVGDKFIVTVRQEDGDTLERARRQVQQQHKRPAPVDALHAVIGTVVDDLADVSHDVEQAILTTADRLFAPQGSDEAHLLYQINRQLLAMAHAVQPLIEPLRHMSDGTSGAADVETARRFQDVLDHALLIDREISGYSDLVEHLRDSNDSRIALQQNTDMRKIAAWAAVIAVPTAITGFYGMNVPYPGFGQTSGVIIAVTVQVILATTLFMVFRRRGWL